LLVVPDVPDVAVGDRRAGVDVADDALAGRDGGGELVVDRVAGLVRSEEHTSELQSQSNLVCRLLLEKKKCSLSRATAGRAASGSSPTRPTSACPSRRPPSTSPRVSAGSRTTRYSPSSRSSRSVSPPH